MIGTSTKEPIPFTPSWLEGQQDAPVYLLRHGSVIERGLMEAELSGEHRAGPVHSYELRAAFLEGVRSLLDDDPDLDRIIEIEQIEADLVSDAAEGNEPKSLSDSDAQILAGAREVLSEYRPAYRSLQARMQRRAQIAPIVAMKRFCVGWENTGIAFARGKDGRVTDDALAAIDPLQLRVAGARAFSLQYGGQEKN
jgi:hypothetical protein